METAKRNLRENNIRIVEIVVGASALTIALIDVSGVLASNSIITFSHLYLAGLAIILLYFALTKTECVICEKRKLFFYAKMIANKKGKYVPICSQHCKVAKQRYLEDKRISGREPSSMVIDGEKFIVPEDSELKR